MEQKILRVTGGEIREWEPWVKNLCDKLDNLVAEVAKEGFYPAGEITFIGNCAVQRVVRQPKLEYKVALVNLAEKYNEPFHKVFEAKCNELTADGWRPIGGIAQFDEGYYMTQGFTRPVQG